MSKPDLQRLIEFQRLLLQFSQIERVIDRKRADGSFVRENDTEHSYNLAMTAWLLAIHFPELDQNMVIQFALIHDLVEIYAGDTYVYADQAHLDSKTQREADALVKLETDWSELSNFTILIHTYESRQSSEARFVYALDKIMPMLQIYINDGKTWHDEQITVVKLDAIKRDKVILSPEIQPYYEALYKLLLESPELIKPN